MRFVRAVLAAQAFWTLAIACVAYDAAAEGAAIADEVLTTDGGTYRGTIVEHAPGSDVVIVLPTGETKRFAAGDVQYAGPLRGPSPPSSPAPEAPSSPVPGSGRETEFAIRGPRISVRFEAAEPTTLYAEDDWAIAGRHTARGYVRLCTSPCTFSMPAGTQHFAMARGEDNPQPLADPLTVRESATLQASVQSRAGLRTAGVVILAAGGLAGIGMVVGALAMPTQESCDQSSFCATTLSPTARALVLAGGLIAAGSITAGIVLMTRHDLPAIEIAPWAPSNPRPAGPPTASDGRRATYTSNGAAITVHF
jgi:hypothetical protein